MKGIPEPESKHTGKRKGKTTAQKSQHRHPVTGQFAARGPIPGGSRPDEPHRKAGMLPAKPGIVRGTAAAHKLALRMVSGARDPRTMMAAGPVLPPRGVLPQ